jgi:dTDP-4-dehydrorhamnose reductase
MTAPRRVAITGAGGRLGRQLVIAFGEAGADLLPLSPPAFDITRAGDLARLAAWEPDLVVNTAAWTDVDGCARDPARAMRINGAAAGQVAAAAARAGAAIVQVSTNEVFDGTLDRPYEESDAPNPINPYGASKLAGEQAVAAANARHLIVRTAWLFGPEGTNFVTRILAAADRAQERGEALRAVDDEWGNPTWMPDLASAIVLAATPSPQGDIVHLAGMPPATRHAWAVAVLRDAGISIEVEAISQAAFERASTVPARAVLRPTPGAPPLSWMDRSSDYVRSLRAAG